MVGHQKWENPHDQISYYRRYPGRDLSSSRCPDRPSATAGQVDDHGAGRLRSRIHHGQRFVRAYRCQSSRAQGRGAVESLKVDTLPRLVLQIG
jgi:hypothetical protein